MHILSEENVAVAYELVLSQEDSPATKYTQQHNLLSYRLFFSPQSRFEEMPTKDLTEAIHYARLNAQDSR